MKKILFTYYLLLVMFFGAVAIITADTVEMDAGSIFLNFEEDNSDLFFSKSISDDYFAGGKDIRFSGKADDLYLMGRRIDFTGKSDGGIVAFGDSVEIRGDVAKNLHIGANNTRITGHVQETAFVGGQDIVVSEEAVVDGTLFSGSSTLHVLGQLNNGLIAGAGEILIDGPVKGDVNVRTGKLIITERGSIRGNLTYSSNGEISKSEKARVSGFVKYEEEENLDEKGWSKYCIIAGIIFFATIIISGLLLLLLPGVKSLFANEREPGNYGKTLLWGLIPVFIYPVVIVVTIPLFPLSIALGLAAFPLIGLALILGLALAGQLLFKVFKWENNSIYLQFLLAFGIFFVLAFIPYVKVLVYLGIAAAGAGLLVGRLFNTDFR